MADLRFIAQTDEISLAGATTKTMVQVLAPGNCRVKILGWGIFFDGVSVASEPVQVTLLKQTSAGTMSALTPVNLNGVAETIQTAAYHTASVEPSASSVLDSCEVHPQSGYEVKYPIGQEIIIGGGERVGIMCVSGAGAATVNCRAKIICEE